MSEPVKINNLCTIEKFAKEQNVSVQTVYNWLKKGKVKRVEFLGHEYIDRSTLVLDF